jgi:murein L,D-transpeptidase YafK
MFMKQLTFCFLLFANICFAQASFRIEQKKHAKVKTAYAEKWTSLKTELSQQSINTNLFSVFFRVFKQEELFEVWVKDNTTSTFKLLKNYKICASSGDLGPKRKEGDMQVPEGFYNINIFNPFSSYYLSLGVSYPNAADKYFSDKKSPGGAIMVHGNCVTIGCIPLTDDVIKEVYVLAVEAKANGQSNIPIHIFPCKLNETQLKTICETNATHQKFWTNLKTGFDYFESHKKLPTISVDKQGYYVFK